VREPDYEREAMKQDPAITNYIKKLSREVMEHYRDARGHVVRGVAGNYVVRKKSIYYDTDGIRENQVESIMVCDDCAGVLKIETASSVNPLCLGVEVPSGACDRCRSEGRRIFEEGGRKGKYSLLQFINRRDKEYLRA
jgi:hypothetical protein